MCRQALRKHLAHSHADEVSEQAAGDLVQNMQLYTWPVEEEAQQWEDERQCFQRCKRLAPARASSSELSVGEKIQASIDSLKRAKMSAESISVLSLKACRAFHEELRVLQDCADVLQDADGSS